MTLTTQRPEFAVFDTETTGLSPREGARLLEIGIIRIDADGNELARYETLVDPGRDAGLGPVDIHGITESMIAGAPSFAEIVGDIADIVRGAVLVAHNAPFDTSFLRNEFYQARLNWPKPMVYDTLAAARTLLPHLVNHKLATVAEHLGVTFAGPAHSALADARVTAGVLIALTERMNGLTWPDASSVNWPQATASGRQHTRFSLV